MWAVALGIAEAQPKQSETFQKPSGPDVGPPVTEADVRIVRRAREILKSPSNWNRPDSRICPPEATTFSLYCALERATIEVGGKFEHRGAAMQEARFVIDAIAPNHKDYKHRLMDYNNDPTTTFADIQRVLRLLEDRIDERLTEQSRLRGKKRLAERQHFDRIGRSDTGCNHRSLPCTRMHFIALARTRLM